MREERKVVTVLFADVVGSTAIAADADPERVRALMARYFAKVEEVAEVHGGTIEKFAGDAVMVVFGVPAAHDDDAERAVRAGLAIGQMVSELQVRVGINSGDAVTGARPDHQFMVSGDTVNVAARLQQSAEPGQVVVGELTHQLTHRSIEYRALEPQHLKGKSQPIPVYAAIQARTSVPVRLTGVPGLGATLIGRALELQLLSTTLTRVMGDRRPHLLTVVGGPGIGKSRLVAELLALPAAASATVLRGRCLPYGRGITYWALFEALQQDFGHLEPGADGLRQLEARMGTLGLDDGDVTAVLARVAVVLGLATPSQAMPDIPAARVGRELGWALSRYLEALARTGPVVLVVDDLQWAEDAFVELIDRVLESVAEVPLLVLCIARTELFERWPNWSAGKPSVTTLTLDALAADQISALISALLRVESLPEPLLSRIVGHSAGTPLFCEEVIRMLIEDGRLVRAQDAWQIAGSVEVQVPRTIQAVLTARLDSLGEDEKATLQAASVIGERFLPEEVTAILGVDTYDAIDAALAKGLLATEPAGSELRFRHVLIRDAAYGSISKADRASFHERFARHLEAASGDPRQLAEILAHHWDRSLSLSMELGLDAVVIGARAKEAWRWALEMGERSNERGDVVALAAALELARRARAAGVPNMDLAARLELLVAEAHVARGEHGQALTSAAAAAFAAAKAGNLTAVARARVLEVITHAGQSIGGFDDIAERAIVACRAAGDLVGELEVRHRASIELYGTGRLLEFLEVQRELLNRAREIGDFRREVMSLRWIGDIEWHRGNVNERIAVTTTMAAIVEKFGLREHARILANRHAGDAFFAGDLETAEAHYEAGLREAEELGLTGWTISELRELAYVSDSRPDHRRTAELVDRALVLAEAVDDRWSRSELYGLRARAALGMGDLELAQSMIEQCLEYLRPDDVTATAEAYENLGAILQAQGRLQDAEAAHQRSVAALAGTAFVWNWVAAVLGYSEFLARAGRSEEAAEMLAEPAAWLAARGWKRWDPQIARIRSMIRPM